MIRRVTLFLAVLSISAASSSYALEGDEYVDFNVNGVSYHALVPNKETRNDFYYLLKAINGDQDARSLLLAGKESRYIFIGDLGVVRWIKLTKDGQEVITH